MAMSFKRHSTIIEQPKQSIKPTTASLGHHRRSSDAQLVLSHPIISRSIQALQNQTRTTSAANKPLSKLSKPPSTTSNKNINFPPKRNIHLSTVTINHGLPSPTTSTTLGSENGYPKSNYSHLHPNQQLSSSSTPTDRKVTASRPTNLQPAPRSQTSKTNIASPLNCPSRVMKPSSHRDSPIPTQLPKRAITTTQPRVSASLGQSSKKILSAITQPSTISSQLHRNIISRRSSTVDGPMSSRSSNSESTYSAHFNEINQPDHSAKNLSTSLLSDATVKPHRSSSGGSSVDLRGSKLKAKDRSKDQSFATLNVETHNLPRSKRLIGMKERNERIFASINASLNSPPRTHPPEPSLPPPPPSSTSPNSSDSPPLSSPISSPKRSSGHLRVPGSHDICSGLIPFAKGCSPSPRKIVTSTQPQASNGRLDNPPVPSTSLNPDGTENDEHYGSVRHKRPERCRLIKRNSPEGYSEADLKSPSHSQGGKMVGHPDRARRQTDPKAEQLPRDTADPPKSDNITNSHRNSRTWSESISMHTSSSDTIGAPDNRNARRSASRSSAVDRETGHHSHHASSMYCEDDHSDGSDYETGQDETMTTPVKTHRSESYQKTLRNANSVSEMLDHRKTHDTEPIPVGRTPRPSLDRRQRSSSLKDEGISHSGREHPADSPPKSSPNINRSPQSHASISRRQRPGLPEHFVQTRHDESFDSETIHSMAEIRRLGLHSSRSPRSNRTQPPTNIGDRSRQDSDYRSYRHSNTIAVGPDRLNGVESALSCYDRQNFYSGGTRFKSVRNKHASWSALDDVGGDLVRSQSVLGGVYDPYTAERRGNRTRTAFPSPISRRTVVYHRHGVGDDDDDGQTSTTTYTNTQSMPRKAGSAGSRSRTSEWAFEDQHNNLRSIRAGSRLGGHTNSLIMSPSRCKSIMERDRTLRGNGGGAAPPPSKPFAQFLRNTYQDKHSPNQCNGDSRSSSSGASSKLLQQSHRALAHRHLTSAKLSDSVIRSSRPPTRATTSAASGLTALLSPTPTVDHHRLLISAYEALDRSPDDFSPEADELNFALNALLSSVVKNSCKIDATLAELNESSLNHQVEMELVDDYMDNQADDTQAYSRQEPSSEQVNQQKYQMMEDSLTHMSKVQAQLVRSSNDHIRDLTEVLICLSKLQRCQKEQHLGTRQQQSFRIPGSDDTRDLYGHGEVPAKDLLRSGSRAGHRFSHSHSPSKLRHTIDLSPLSVISSTDESPLSRVKANNGNESSHHSMTKPSGLVSNSTNGFGPQHHRASTISFTHNRELSFEGVAYQQRRAKNRVSAMSSTSIRQMGESFYDASHGGSSQSRKREPHLMDSVTVDEFGLYRKASEHTLRSPATDSKDHHHHHHHARPESAWSRAETHGGGHAVRGSLSSAMFPKTPPRLPTSSISQTTAHSNVSPTNPSRHSLDGRSQRLETSSSNMLRPQSSMSKILHRANSVLSRVEHYPVITSQPSGRKQTQETWEGSSMDPSMDESRALSRRAEPLMPSSQQQRGQQRSEPSEEREGQSDRYRVRQVGHRRNGPSGRPSSSLATAALERLSRLGTHSRASLHSGDSDVEEQMSELQRSSTSSYLASGPSDSDGVNDHGGPRRHRVHQSPDQSHLPLDHLHHRASTLTLHDQINHNHSVGIESLNHNLNHNGRRRKGSIQSLFGGLKRSAQAKR